MSSRDVSDDMTLTHFLCLRPNYFRILSHFFILTQSIISRSSIATNHAHTTAPRAKRGGEQRLHGFGEDRVLLRDGRFHRQSLLGGFGPIRIVLQRTAVHGERHREGTERDRQRAREEPAERRLQAVRAREGSREFGPSVSFAPPPYSFPPSFILFSFDFVVDCRKQTILTMPSIPPPPSPIPHPPAPLDPDFPNRTERAASANSSPGTKSRCWRGRNDRVSTYDSSS